MNNKIDKMTVNDLKHQDLWMLRQSKTLKKKTPTARA